MSDVPLPEGFVDKWIPGIDGTEFYTRTYTASSPKAVLLFVHGFGGHCGLYESMHAVYVMRGITVFVFDQRGFGRTASKAETDKAKAFYGRTSWREQIRDLEWFVKHVKDQHPTLPLFLMGHSMGGAVALAFATRTRACGVQPPTQETVSLLAGVIASSAFILRATPTARHVRLIAWLASFVLPDLVLNTPINPDNLSHDTVRNEASSKDPLVVHKGSLRILNDMLGGGEHLLWTGYKNWPTLLPLLMVHGSGDKVTSFHASKEFFEKVKVTDKQFVPFEDAYHNLFYEPEGVKELYIEEGVAWILRHAQDQSS